MAEGPACTCVMSRTRTPSSALATTASRENRRQPGLWRSNNQVRAAPAPRVATPVRQVGVDDGRDLRHDLNSVRSLAAYVLRRVRVTQVADCIPYDVDHSVSHQRTAVQW